MSITIGTRINCVLPHAGRGIVYGIHGEQQPGSVRVIGGIFHSGGAAHFDIVFDNGHISQKVPESIIRGVQWSILPEIATAEQIAEALAYSACLKAEKANAAELAAQRFAAEVERLRADPAHARLKQGDDSASGKLAAQNIRAELKAAFPGIRFGVRKAHWGSVSVTWTDGPTEKRVGEIVNKYQGGHFNGMDDIYERADSPWTSVFGGSKYVFTSREFSAEMIARAIEALFATHRGLDGIERPTPETAFRSFVAVPGEQWDLGTLIRLQAVDMEAGQ
ncbi:hypothetical protein M529_03680 [Sphingobium ummariense RL-3]|uniref:Large polyvalent protein associated domain-containing protein n=2 Tax=Sphingobium TaxID=165695 RepID=T0IXT1_9SPHN|nr:hypothetical protein M529_03680 [Sphingobium ummariense RL-3]